MEIVRIKYILCILVQVNCNRNLFFFHYSSPKLTKHKRFAGREQEREKHVFVFFYYIFKLEMPTIFEK